MQQGGSSHIGGTGRPVILAKGEEPKMGTQLWNGIYEVPGKYSLKKTFKENLIAPAAVPIVKLLDSNSNSQVPAQGPLLFQGESCPQIGACCPLV